MEEIEYIGDLDRAWRYYSRLVEDIDSNLVSEPVYVGDDDNEKKYGIRVADEKDRHYDPERHPRPDGWD